MKNKEYLKRKQHELLIQIDNLAIQYNEKITSRLYKSIRETDWDNADEDVIELMYQDLEEVYTLSLPFLKECYEEVQDSPLFISDYKTLTYHKDGLDIEQRIKKYVSMYQNAGLEIQKELIPYHFNRILHTENRTFYFNVAKQKSKNTYKEGYVWVADVYGDGDDCNGVCEDNWGEMMLEADVEEPPFHPDCNCEIFWYSIPADEVQYL